ncbi:MAG: hypothetical protein BGO78_01765 [Chloroflexi bacterium 44-23]|nr:MAG: hypothetical protein BGO78_01765 [Chloroflexi bacterium 44-23]
MAKISLREYIREIENLIDRGDTQKAIAHCKHLLRFYPKHIDTYRLFGKALLEMQKYGDASDIFQRVLSSVPDDFISQIGMSIIKEDENNLDAAIWHLERAFEIQPSNKAVQDELKRLYSSRDGVLPTKIRLTRGALVRMYARGELYSQAIAEIKAALIEDPNRVDLEVILGRLYYILGQKLEATETASKLIAMLPYCYEANRILAEILPGTSRDEDAKIFRQRVIDLDPYFEFVNESIPNPIDIADNNVMVEYLDWDPTTAESDQPDWAKSIGLDWDTGEKIAAPSLDSWLSDEMDLTKPREENVFPGYSSLEENHEEQEQPEKIDSSSYDVDETIVPESKTAESELINVNENETIPAWMAEVGWEVSDEVNPDLEKGFNFTAGDEEIVSEIASGEELPEIEPGIIPDWVKQLAPSEELRAEGIIDEDDQFIDDKNFEKLFSVSPVEEEEEDFFKNLNKSQDWMKEFETESDELIRRDEVEGLVSELENQEFSYAEESEEIILPAEESDSGAGTFSTDAEIEEEEKEEINLPAISESATEVTADVESSWFRDFIPDEGKVKQVDGEEEEDKSFLSFLPEIGDTDQEEPQAVPQEGDFSWLNALQSSAGDEDIPAEEELPQPTEKKDLDAITEDDDEEFKDIFTLIDPTIKESIQESEEIDLSSLPLEEKTPDWLESLMQNIPEQQPEDAVTKRIDSPSFEAEPETTAEPDLATKKIESPSFESGTPINADEETVIEDSSSEEIESAFSWMEELVTKHSKTEQMTSFDNISETPAQPDWLKDFKEEAIEEEPDPFMESSKEAEQDFLDDDLTPSWLKALQDESQEPDEIVSELAHETDEISQEIDVTSLELDDEFEALSAVEDVETHEEVEPVADIEQEYVEASSALKLDDEIISQIDGILEPEKASLLSHDQEIEEDIDFDLSTQVPEHVEDGKLEEALVAAVDFKEKPDSEIRTVEEELVIQKQVQGDFEKNNVENLVLANKLLNKGEVENAVTLYNGLIQSKSSLDEIIRELKEALDHRYPIDISLWQTLGDAYVRKNQLQNALDAYTKAEELIS